MSGAMPGKTTAGARSVPCDEVTSTRSPSAMPIFSAVFGLISTQLLPIADVSGSGSSRSHGRCAVEPSPNAGDAYGRKWNGKSLADPSNAGSFHAGASRPVADGGRPAAGGWLDFATSSAVFHGSSIGAFSFPATAISTSAVARVSWIGFIAGPTAVVFASSDPDSGVASTHDSRNE